jgi:uncharacterized protein
MTSKGCSRTKVHRRGRARLWSASLALAFGLRASAYADVKIPAAPKDYFNDGAGLVSPADAARLNDKLRAFDEQTSTQIIVAILPELPEASLEDFTIRAAQAWRVGQKKLNNGAVLFVFPKERKTRIEVGYGLEGALPDATCKDILQDRLAPLFRDQRYAEGLEAAIDAMMAATRGEYKAAARPRSRNSGVPGCATVLVLLLFLFFPLIFRPRWRTFGGGGWWTGGGGFGGGGGWGGGGGFSGGGGSFGGGGSSGNW